MALSILIFIYLNNPHATLSTKVFLALLFWLQMGKWVIEQFMNLDQEYLMISTL